MKPLILVSIILMACACSKQRDNSAPADFSQERLAKLSSEFCKAGEHLKEIDLNTNKIQLQHLRFEANVFGIMNGSTTCALTRDINDTWGVGWFTVWIHSECLRNGSFWAVRDSDDDGGIQSFNFKSLDATDRPDFYLGGPPTLNATHARDHAGLRPMECQLDSAN